MTYLHNSPPSERASSVLTTVEEKFGFVPNFLAAQSERPDLINAQLIMVDCLLLSDSALSRKQKEYIFLVCSAANLSTYCVTAHCEMLRMMHVDGPEPEQIAVDHLHANIPVRDKALLNFCTKLNSRGDKVASNDLESLGTYGFTEQQILEAVLVVGLARFANTVAFGLGTVPDFQNRRVAEELGKARVRAYAKAESGQ
jgi:uncharacterized peroxidase-related enzyme